MNMFDNMLNIFKNIKNSQQNNEKIIDLKNLNDPKSQENNIDQNLKENLVIE